MEWIFELRHRVYAEELGQHATSSSGRLSDDLDGRNVYLVATDHDGPVGFVGLTPPWAGRYRLDHYCTREELPVLDDPAAFEVRLLTVEPHHRLSGFAGLLMYAALRWVTSRGGRTIVAMGRGDLLEMYRAVGLTPIGRTVRSGAVDFEVMTADVAAATSGALRNFAEVLAAWQARARWLLDASFRPAPDGCEHGGSSFAAIGTDMRTLDRRKRVVAADVLDAWFAPAPGVRAILTEDPDWMSRTSPPTDAHGLIAEVSAARDLPVDSIAVGAGSSDLIFRAFTHWLTPASRVLLVDPGYGEYAHVTGRVVGCRVDRFVVRRSDGWRIDTDRLAASVAANAYDLVVVVNPNNPTGRHLAAADLRAAIEATRTTAAATRWWIDEAYIGYVDLAESLAPWAAAEPGVAVCTSLSKMYALSGLRAAFITAEPRTAADLRRLMPPWQVGLPAQLAAVAALRDPEHYRAAWARTHELRREMVRDLGALGVGEVEESVANFLTLTLPAGGPSAAEFVRSCRAQGVHLRDLSALSPQYEGRTVRVAVRDTTENALIVAACDAAGPATRPAVPANLPGAR